MLRAQLFTDGTAHFQKSLQSQHQLAECLQSWRHAIGGRFAILKRTRGPTGSLRVRSQVPGSSISNSSNCGSSKPQQDAESSRLRRRAENELKDLTCHSVCPTPAPHASALRGPMPPTAIWVRRPSRSRPGRSPRGDWAKRRQRGPWTP